MISTAAVAAALAAAGCGSSTIVQPAAAPTTASARNPDVTAPAQSPSAQQTSPSAAQQQPVQSPSASPADTVRAYFAAITNHDYALAWALGGENTGSSYSSFVSGFGTTVSDTVTIQSVSGDVVSAQLAAEQTDGSVLFYQGTYTVSDGVIVGFDVHQVG